MPIIEYSHPRHTKLAKLGNVSTWTWNSLRPFLAILENFSIPFKSDNYEIIMQLLPKRLIVELSSYSPNSLAALTLTDTSYQREAERACYDTLVISTFSNDSLKYMETLATNPERAA